MVQFLEAAERGVMVRLNMFALLCLILVYSGIGVQDVEQRWSWRRAVVCFFTRRISIL